MTKGIPAIGGAAGFSGDRWDAAGPVAATLIARAGPAAVIFEPLAERTLALAQLARRRDASSGYEPALEKFLRPVIRRCLEHGIPIVGNFGAANPHGVAARIREVARDEGAARIRIAVVEGDDLSDESGKALLAGYLDSRFTGRD